MFPNREAATALIAAPQPHLKQTGDWEVNATAFGGDSSVGELAGSLGVVDEDWPYHAEQRADCRSSSHRSHSAFLCVALNQNNSMELTWCRTVTSNSMD